MTMATTTASATRLPPRARALRFAAFGGPEVLSVEIMDITPAAEGEAVVAVRAASINPSDVKNVAGRMRQTVPPRTTGRDFAGIVVDGPSSWLGARVWGTGGDIGFKRDGSHAEYLRLPVEALARMPAKLEFQQAAAVGVNYVTAQIGLDYAGLAQGETLVVIGATGGVGGAACVIGAARGARVLAACRGAPAPASPARHAGAEVIDITAIDLAAAVAELTKGEGANVIYDCVGRPDLTQAALASLAFRGRLLVIAGTPGEQVPLELIPFYRRECRLIGVDSLKRSAAECAPMMEALRQGFEDGTHPPPAIAAVYDLSRGAEAYADVARGTRGRIVLTMGDS
ncbi:zinc-binding alcohol dehydrogenase family protein [Falsiroseomonas sp.]|uniref:quinone oxidoreductase family protein n=1 Tax=Falsiroseomonas sp. TaxID=2870721 RepID=UPI0034A11B6F